MATTDQAAPRTQALCWLLDELLDAEDDLLELVARPGALVGWRRERLGEFSERIGAALLAQWSSPAQALAGFTVPIDIEIGVPLAQEHLGLGVGADLAAAVPTTSRWWSSCGDSAPACSGPVAAAAVAKIPGPLDVGRSVPHPAAPFGFRLPRLPARTRAFIDVVRTRLTQTLGRALSGHEEMVAVVCEMLDLDGNLHLDIALSKIRPSCLICQ